MRILLASSNPGKLGEYQELATGTGLEISLMAQFSELPRFEESAPTFAENAAGKALHYSRFTKEPVLADDSGLVVPGLGGAPGVQSARYAGPSATDSDRVEKLLHEMEGEEGEQRRAHFVCVIAVAHEGRALVIASDRADGVIAKAPSGLNGFGYDPIFYVPEKGCTYAELPSQEKNRVSHRGRAFRKIAELLRPVKVPAPS
ncbi:MAG TPA: RdgB/HAM1 family non-canonical purine NTP pyrophosphatase [Verrucomicrobiae bacterium]|nr:RdgB/HAM1 family non-canonical purine NTP pyrophosphatase [Verrucomicrobiae bacterium]